jgi:NAD(P)H-flavin reductase
MAGTAVLGRLNWKPADVLDVVTETPRTKTIAFRVPAWPGHQAGQHVDVRLTSNDGYQAERSYSIASAPDRTRLELTVERLDDGEVSPYLTDELRRGDRIELRGPVGGYFVWEPPQGGPVLLLRRIRGRATHGNDPDTKGDWQQHRDAASLLLTRLGRRHLSRRTRPPR